MGPIDGINVGMTTSTAATITVTVTGEASGFAQTIHAREHTLHADEPRTAEGATDTGPSPYELLCSALGACTSMTVAMYARRKAWPLERVHVTLTHHKEPGTPRADKIDRVVRLEGPLDDAQRARLLEIANKCPVHQTLTAGVEVATSLEK